MSDLVVTVRQIANYPNIGVSNGSETLLLQQGGLGGPYATLSTGALVSTALNTGGSLGVGTGIPADASSGHVFTATNHVLPLNGTLMWNSYWDGSEFRNWGANIAAFIGAGADGFTFSIGTAAGADQPSTFTDVMSLTVAGHLNLPLGTLTVARDPSALMDVATLNWVSNNTVASFNGRIGRVQLTQGDVYGALQLDSAIATQNWSIGAINAAIGDFVSTYPLVTCWNGRTGNVYLTLSDITCVFYQPGQQPISPTPALTSNDDSIATTKWVTEYIANEFAGGGGNLATQSWVLANTVNSFNGRRGVVTLTQADVLDVGAAPLNNPNFSGVPTAPTAAVGQATGQIATTAFVQQAISANTAGVSTFNTRTGDVTLSNADIVAAGGLANPSPNLTGAPTAPTAAPGTNTPQIANTQFVMTALGNAVTSFNTRTGAVVLTLADITGVGGAPIVSPAFSSVPTAPTAAPGTNTVQLATCAFVTQALNAAGGVSSFNGRTGAVDLIGNDISAAGGLVNPSVNLTGIPTAPTPATNTNTTQIATTAFVVAALGGTVTSFNTRSGAVTLTGADISAAGGALLASPSFTGAPTAPTATAGTNNTQLATTQFVQSAILADTSGVTSFNTRTGAVTLITADITAAGGAPSASPAFTGIPVGPTATAGTATTQLATTQFVMSAIASAGVASFNGRTGAVTLIANDISAASGALIASPTFTGTPAAPTAAPGTNTTQLATCAYVMAAIRSPATVAPLMNGTAAVGTSLLYARQDHIHPRDTTLLPLTGGNLTGSLGINNGSNDPLTISAPAANSARTMYSRPGRLWSCGELPNGTFSIADETAAIAAINISSGGGPTEITGGVNVWAFSGGNAYYGLWSPGGATTWGSLYYAVSSSTLVLNHVGSGAQYTLGPDGNCSCNPGGTGNFIVTPGIGYQTGGGEWGSLSDARIKEVQHSYSHGLAEIVALRPVVYRYKGNDRMGDQETSMHAHAAESGKTFVGLVAQEAETVMPEMVGKRAGWIDGERVDDLRDMNTTPLTFALVNAVRELAALATMLRERIEALEARMAEMGA